ncbi:ASCH domain-containing protein [uncultured Lactobacillus sp.]|uniref:ASCH domain-containing protein n=1 Tax=uncultured Lactobacillus sp. TaxID=153152 RepID=UPI002632594E|nr:ASCH domain-containing protein [uncultured Lactobacillus sp.]
MNKKLELFWHDFCQRHNLNLDTPVDAWAFGATAVDADELAELVNQGIKTATTSAYELYGKDEKLPKAGEWSIILNSKQEPVCVILEKVVEIIPYNLISQEHAYHEGEGDRSYEYWKQVHDEFFTLEYEEAGKKFYPQAPMVCEVFEKVE